MHPTETPPPGAEAPPAPESGFHLYSFLLGLLTSLLLVGGTLLLLRQPDPPAIVLQPPPTPLPTAAPSPTPTPGPITVFVSGGVISPGLVELPAGSRVGAAIAAAGGLHPGADLALVNQAQLLWDGAQVHVPVFAETGEASGPDLRLSLSPPVGVSGQENTFTAGALAGSPSTGGRININTASAAELESLPGIGPARAQAIIDHRPFSSVEDLERVPGIGPKTLESLREQVTIN